MAYINHNLNVSREVHAVKCCTVFIIPYKYFLLMSRHQAQCTIASYLYIQAAVTPPPTHNSIYHHHNNIITIHIGFSILPIYHHVLYNLNSSVNVQYCCM